MAASEDVSAFYVPDGDGFRSTELTRGPWDPGNQHAGPPCALLGRTLDGAGGLERAQLARVTYEILRPVPIARLETSAAVMRPGRNVELVEGVLSHEGQDVIRARAWRIRTAEVEADGHAPEPVRMPAPDTAESKPFFPTGWDIGYHSAMEVRFVEGGFVEPGPARAWMRMRVALVEGEEPAPRDRVLVAADSGNGVSAPLDYRRFVFINTDLTVNLRRLPEGEWVCLDAVTYADRHGIGMSDTALHDERGMIGRATQALLIADRD
ncbi:MAG TPA: thioesterase family protein [Thermoleophilaceae bacterium]|nr:thioesterase family protein [Thermoleophilaceae bacterium]